MWSRRRGDIWRNRGGGFFACSLLRREAGVVKNIKERIERIRSVNQGAKPWCN
jgi:hypothetical protein